MGGNSKPSTQKTNSSSTTTSTATPYAPAQPLLDDMLARAQVAQGATPTTPVYTGPNQQQTQAQGMLTALVPQLGAGADPMAALAAKTASGGFLDPATNRAMGGSGWKEDLNPALQGAIQAAINPLRDQLDQNVLSIGDAAKMAGAYGGDRGELLKGTALSRFNRDSMDVGSTLWYNAYEAMQGRNFQANQNDFSQANQAQEMERQRQNNAGALFQDANQLAMDPARVISALGDQTAGWDLARNQSAVDAPWAGLDRYSQLIAQAQPYMSQTGTQVGESTTIGTPAKGSSLAGAASGALGGASAGAAFGPWGAGIGAVVGGLGGLFG